MPPDRRGAIAHYGTTTQTPLGQTMNFDRCVVGNVVIPRHGDDNGRENYWNMFEEPVGDIVCTKGGNTYTYPAHSTLVWGGCS